MNKKKITAAVMSLIMVFSAAGCSSKTDENRSRELISEVQKGRYIETEIPGLSEAQDGYCPGEFIKSGDNVSFCPDFSNVIFTSAGDSFEFGINDIKLSDECIIGKIMRQPNGAGAVLYYDNMGGTFETSDDEGDETTVNVDMATHFGVIAPDGSIIETELGGSSAQTDGREIYDFEVTSDGRIFAVTYDGTVYEIDPSTGKAERLTQIYSSTPLKLDICGKYIFFTSGVSEKVYVYDLEAGSLYTNTDVLDNFWKNNISNDNLGEYTDNYDLCEGEEGTVYIVCLKGIYRYVLGGNTVEQLVDGSCSSFGITGSFGNGIGYACYEGNDSFLVQCAENKLMRYRFDPEADDVTKNTLRIFTLKTSQELMTAVNFYRQSNPSVEVIVEEGMADGRTYEDAMKELTTQIVSDTPPDVIILDDMDINSLKEKGALADISGDIKALSPEGGLLEGAALWNNDGGLYSAAGAFSLPSIACDTGDIDSIKDFTTLADLAEKNFDKKNNTFALSLEDIPQENFAENMLLLNGSEILDEKGEPDTAKIKTFYENCKRIYDASSINDGAMEQYDPFRLMTSLLTKDTISSTMAPVLMNDYKSDINLLTSLYDYKKDVQIKYGIDDSTHSFIPKLNTAVCSSAKEPEGAKAFIGSLLSAETQENLSNSSLTVNRKVFEKNFIDDNESVICFSLMTDEGEKFYEPKDTNEAEEKQLMDYIDKLDTAVIFDSQTKDEICSCCAKYLRGETDLDTAVQETESFLSLRNKE